MWYEWKIGLHYTSCMEAQSHYILNIKKNETSFCGHRLMRFVDICMVTWILNFLKKLYEEDIQMSHTFKEGKGSKEGIFKSGILYSNECIITTQQKEWNSQT